MKVFTGDSYTITMGTNREENAQILMDALPDDIWLHLEEGSSPHAILHVEGRVSSKMLRQASHMIKNSSRARKEDSVKVMWTRVKNVKPTSIIGEVEIEGEYNVFYL